MIENQKWQREIDLERDDELKREFKNKRAGDVTPSAPTSYLCWWYFDIKR